MVSARDLDSAPIIREQVVSCAVHLRQRVWQTVVSAIDDADEAHKFMVSSFDGNFVRVRVVDAEAKDGDRIKAIQMIILGLSHIGVMLRVNTGRHFTGLVLESTKIRQSRGSRHRFEM